jgi:hypothetical protein
LVLYGFFVFIAISSLVALHDRRKGLVLFLLIGLTQDPARKMVPEAPGYFTLCTAPVLFALIAGLIKTGPGFWDEFRAWHPKLAMGIFFFAVSLLPGAGLSVTYGPGSWLYTAMGIFSYGVVIFGIAVGFFWPEKDGDIERFLAVYCLLCAPMLGGAYLEYLGMFPGWPVLGTSTLGHEWIRHIPGVVVKMVAGFFRSPDIMGWHAAMVVMLSLLFAFRSSGWKARLLWIAVGCWASVAMVLCGRRKMLYMIPVFVSCFLWAYYFWGTGARRAGVVSVLLLAVIFAVAGYQAFNPDSTFLQYYTYDPADAFKRLEKHGLQAVLTTFYQSGIFGEGLGFASTGAQHIPAPRPRTWQEGGLSRIAVELGLPGLVCLLFLGLQFAREGLQVVGRRIHRNDQVFLAAATMFAILIANVSSFIVSGGHFGDPFITSFLAIFVGLFFSTVRFAGVEKTETLLLAQNVESVSPTSPSVRFEPKASSPLRDTERWEEIVLSFWSKRR